MVSSIVDMSSIAATSPCERVMDVNDRHRKQTYGYQREKWGRDKGAAWD